MVKTAIQKFLSVFGYRLVSADNFRPNWNLIHFFPMLKGLGFAPMQIWDVGANRGDWTRAAIHYFPDSEYTLLEPQDGLKKSLQDLMNRGHKIRWINAGAGAQPGLLPFYVHLKDEGSSFVPLPRIKQEAAQCIEVPVRTLDEVLVTLSLPVPEMLKIDAEGLDLEVLKGAATFLGKTEVVLVEASIGQLDFENNARAVINAMDEYGYRFMDITDVNHSPTHGVLWLCEFAFVRKSSGLMDSASRY